MQYVVGPSILASLKQSPSWLHYGTLSVQKRRIVSCLICLRNSRLKCTQLHAIKYTFYSYNLGKLLEVDDSFLVPPNEQNCLTWIQLNFHTRVLALIHHCTLSEDGQAPCCVTHNNSGQKLMVLIRIVMTIEEGSTPWTLYLLLRMVETHTYTVTAHSP